MEVIMETLLLITVIVIITSSTAAHQQDLINRPTIAGTRLYNEVIGKYNKYILPVETTYHNQLFFVSGLLGLTVFEIIAQVCAQDEKNQIMTTSVWIRHEWQDANLVWDPREYNNITKIEMPADDLWLPDTVLYNNADGDYQITIRTKVMIYHDGRIVWEPPAIYKSFCYIDVTYFPFDTQTCELKFGPWSYDVSKVDYRLYYPFDSVDYKLVEYLDQCATDMRQYALSEEWDILRITGNRTVWKYPCCTEQYVDIKYRFHIRRKTLYYTVNLIIPVLLMSFLTIFVFYLPSQSGEKITLSISILVSMTLFILLLYDIIPPTSLALPLMCRYLLFSMILVTFSTIMTILVLSIHLRHAHAYDMAPWIRRVFLHYLPKLLFYETPGMKRRSFFTADSSSSGGNSQCLYDVIPANNNNNNYEIDSLSSAVLNHRRRSSSRNPSFDTLLTSDQPLQLYENVDPSWQFRLNSAEIKQALRDVRFISAKFREENEEDRKQEDWEAVARVLDRLFLVIFTTCVVFGCCAIFGSAPALYDTTPPLHC